MKAKNQKVTAFEANARLSELLRETEQGASYIICRRGKKSGSLIEGTRTLALHITTPTKYPGLRSQWNLSVQFQLSLSRGGTFRFKKIRRRRV